MSLGILRIFLPNAAPGGQFALSIAAAILMVWWLAGRRSLPSENGEEWAASEQIPISIRQGLSSGARSQVSKKTPYRPNQDNAALIRAAKASRPALEEAARKMELAKRQRRKARLNALDVDRRQSHNAPHPSVSPVSKGSTAVPHGWIGNGQSVTIAGRAIGGMIYVGTAPRLNSYGYGDRCKPYIDPGLPVAAAGSDRSGANMHYWPSYSDISPVCRATYLDWLAEGRSDGSLNAGYMFLYFYGLERRFLIDQPGDTERHEILAEAERLGELFADNHSAQRYLSEFIDLARIVLREPEITNPVFERDGWDLPLSLKVALGHTVGRGEPLSSEWLLSWFLCHPYTQLRTPGRRCASEFQELFKIRFDAKHPNGLTVRKPRKMLSSSYRAASGEFNCSVDLSADGNPIPDVSGSNKPIQIARTIADAAMDDLDKFSRYLGRNPEGRGSLEAHALLPTELWPLFPSEELEELTQWSREAIASGGQVPAVEVVARLEGAPPEKIGKRQLTGAADALARIGFGLAPDPRYSLRGPKIDEPVFLFELGAAVEQLEVVSAGYRAALVEIALATFVAHADQRIADEERKSLKERIGAFEELSGLERRRLDANLDWFLAVPPDLGLLRKRLKDADEHQQQSLRAAVIAIAHADRIIHTDEVAGIEKIYRAFGIDVGLVYSDLHAGEVLDGPVRVKAAEVGAPGEAIPAEKIAALDLARIAAIQSDTKRVSSVLGEIFAVEEDDEAGGSKAPSPQSLFAGLGPRHASFVREIIVHDHLSEEVFGAMAKKHKLMPSGVLEAINEWAFDKYDEALLDFYDGYDVAPEIAGVLKAEMQMETQ